MTINLKRDREKKKVKELLPPLHFFFLISNRNGVLDGLSKKWLIGHSQNKFKIQKIHLYTSSIKQIFKARCFYHNMICHGKFHDCMK